MQHVRAYMVAPNLPDFHFHDDEKVKIAAIHPDFE
jgi:hypothetical protein